MSWLELDDGILEHPKFIRAVKLGGSEAVHLWLGLRAYCGQHLTDGAIPRDMLYEVRGPSNPKKRAAALAVLFSVGLLEDDGATNVQMHDFLDWSSSRDAVLAARERARERKARSRGSHGVTDGVTPLAVTPVVTPVVTHPSPLHSSSTPLTERDPPTPSVLAPQGADIAKTDLDSFAPDPKAVRSRKPKPAQWRRFPVDFQPDESHRKLAQQLGLNLPQQLQEIRDHEFAKPHADPAATLRTWLRNAPKFGAATLGAARAHRPDPRNEAQDRNADHDARAALARSRGVRELLALADSAEAGANHG